jgi:predicted nucleic acid-binding protein
MPRLFFDTNILVYSADRRDARKHAAAIACLADALREGSGCVSTQVLAEYARVALEKLGLSEDAVIEQLSYFEQFDVVPASAELIRRGIELRRLHKLSFWDAQIVAAAEAAGCETLVSEDFAHGAKYGTVRAMDPFRA